MLAFALVAAALFAAGPAAALDCVDYELEPHTITTWNSPGNAWGVAPYGDTMVVVADNTAIEVVDVSNPALPAVLGTVPITAGQVLEIAVGGTHAYALSTAAADNLLVVDISAPTSPSVVATLTTSSRPGGTLIPMLLKVMGDRLLVPDLSYNLRIVDISDPTAPSFIDEVKNPGQCLEVETSGSLAYALFTEYITLSGTVVVVDPSTTPATVVGKVSYPEPGMGLAVEQDRAYVLAGDHQNGNPYPEYLHVIDVSNPAVPALIASPQLATRQPYTVGKVGVDGGVVIVTDGELRFWSVADPAAPLLLGSVAASVWSDPLKVGDVLYVPGGLFHVFGIRGFDFYSPAATGAGFSSLNDVLVDGDFGYAATGSGLQVLDLADPGLAPLGALDTGDAHAAYQKAGDLLYTATGSALRILDVSNPAAPAHLGATSAPGTDVAVLGSYAVLSDATGLSLIDVSNPAAPAVVDVAAGNYLAVAEGGGRVYASADNGTGGALRVIDVTSAPGSIGFVTQALVTDPAPWLEVRYPYAYTVSYDPVDAITRIHSWDVSGAAPQTPPVHVGTVDVGRIGWGNAVDDTAIADDLLYITRSNRWCTYDLSSGPAAFLSQYDFAPGSPAWIGADGASICVGSATSAYRFAPQCRTNAVGAPAVAAGTHGTMLRVRPNPAPGGATIAFSLLRDGPARVDVFDVAGRRVVELASGHLARDGVIRWDGTGRGGAPVPAGVYFVRLESAEATAVEKLVLLR
jgi:hypothetical protein